MKLTKAILGLVLVSSFVVVLSGAEDVEAEDVEAVPNDVSVQRLCFLSPCPGLPNVMISL